MRKFTNRLLLSQSGLFLMLLLFALSACTTSSGIFAGGGRWQAGSLQNQHLQVLAVDPNHLRDIYAGDAHNGIFISINSGVTWKQSSKGLPLPVAVSALSFDIPGKKLYAATSAGLYVSNDAATTWNSVANVPVDSYTALTFDVNSPQMVYVGTTHSGVFKSSDAGDHWTNISHGLPADALTSLLYDPSLKQLWAAFVDTVYRSDDNGANWHVMSNGIPSNAGINTLALGGSTFNDTNLIFAGTAHGFYRSTDAGQHWAASQLSLANLHISAILLDATQANIVYISTNIGVLRSQDSGQNWEQLAAGLPTDQASTGLVQGNDNNTQLFTTSHGIYLYPGNGVAATSAQYGPILLIALFFGLIYWFLIARRRKKSIPAARLAPSIEDANVQNEPKSDEKGL
jgi:photosystem II stability/assembly factor-like uncharacterized protein